MSAIAKINVSALVREFTAGDLGNTKKLHKLVAALAWVNGTGTDQIDKVWSDRRTAAAAADTLDLRSVLTDQAGAVIVFAKVSLLIIVNRATTTGYTLLVGAGSNPWITWLIATGDGIKLGPAGGIVLWNPIDGYATTASTGDILTIDPSANTIEYDIIVAGKSA